MKILSTLAGAVLPIKAIIDGNKASSTGGEGNIHWLTALPQISVALFGAAAVVLFLGVVFGAIDAATAERLLCLVSPEC